jgi:hypothetical protein
MRRWNSYVDNDDDGGDNIDDDEMIDDDNDDSDDKLLYRQLTSTVHMSIEQFRTFLEKQNIQFDDVQCLALFAYFDDDNDG